jgi:hypothetical protein
MNELWIPTGHILIQSIKDYKEIVGKLSWKSSVYPGIP